MKPYVKPVVRFLFLYSVCFLLLTLAANLSLIARIVVFS